MPLTIGRALQEVRLSLADVSDNAAYEARTLLAHIIQQSSTWLYAHPEVELSTTQYEQLSLALSKRQSGYPLAYLLGKRGFFHWDFAVNEAVLIPRPETELLVETAAAFLKKLAKPDPIIVDIGTGSGIIAISLALLFPQATVFAIDISPAALEVAQHNAHTLGASNIQFLHSNLLANQPINTPIDLIAANLPYIPSADLSNLDVARWEPQLALDGGDDGLDLIRQLLPQAKQFLSNTAMLILEIGAAQGAATHTALREIWPDAQIKIQSDLAGLDRLAVLETKKIEL